MVLVSVVVPVRNRERLLPATLESVLAQTLSDWECIVVDDGSTDGTPDVIERYRACDRRIRGVRSRAGSAAGARNHGLRASRGRHVAFLDSDDLFPPDRLEWQVSALERDRDLVLVYGDTLQFDPRTGAEAIYLQDGPRPQGPYAFEALLATSAIYAPTVRRRAMCDVGGFDESLPSAEDWDAWLALSKRGGVSFEPRVALRYRLHAGNKSAHLPRNLRCARRVLEKHLPDVPTGRRARVRRAAEAGFRARYAPRLLDAAQAATRDGDWETARPLWRVLALLDPARLRRRSVLLHAVWSCLPTREAPEWREWIGPEREEAHRG